MKDLIGRNFLITGATEGIGKAAARAFALRGASLTLIGRNRDKTKSVLDELKKIGTGEIDMLVCDLSSIASVKESADEFRSKHSRLDVLVNNADATFRVPILGPDGYELTFALNHLSHFQLTLSLMDLIRATPNARVISTSSAMQARGNLDPRSTPTSLEGPGWRAYATSKLANILFTKELQRHLNDTTATANCFEPGSVKTKFGGFGSDQGFFLNLIYKIAAPFSKTPEQGADSLIWLATAPEAGALKGEFVSNRKAVLPQKQALDRKLAEELWAVSEKLCAQVKKSSAGGI